MSSSRKTGRNSWSLFRGTPRSREEGERLNPAQAALDAASGEPVPIASGRGALYRHDITLAELQPGECGTVRRFIGTAQARLRLLEMGLTPGTHVKLIRIAPFGGPLDILVRGYQLSLRREEAAAVWLSDGEDEATP